jgi:hypothetical protein
MSVVSQGHMLADASLKSIFHFVKEHYIHLTGHNIHVEFQGPRVTQLLPLYPSNASASAWFLTELHSLVRLNISQGCTELDPNR